VRLAIPDYQYPDAIMLTHYDCSILPLLEEMATAIAPHCGVILLSGSPLLSEAFVSRQAYPEYFQIITGAFDSPWIRDRSPFAVATESGTAWFVPECAEMDRPYDDSLFKHILLKPSQTLPIKPLSQGNLIVADRGWVFATSDLLSESGLLHSELSRYNSLLGITQWYIFDGFSQEMTGHADVHIRVLSPSLIAVAWNLSSSEDRHRIKKLIQMIHAEDHSITILKIPIRSRGTHYASLLNWIQLGDRLFLPRYTLTPPKDINTATELLNTYGYIVHFIDSPTLKEGGSLHCLSASVFIS